jgi:hypothetical protein
MTDSLFNSFEFITPAVCAKYFAVFTLLNELSEQQMLFSCVHSVNGVKGVHACADHPRLGLMCPECWLLHEARHDPDDDWRCDQCERTHVLITRPRFHFDDEGFLVRDPLGRWAQMTGGAWMHGFGVCEQCRGDVAPDWVSAVD